VEKLVEAWPGLLTIYTGFFIFVVFHFFSTYFPHGFTAYYQIIDAKKPCEKQLRLLCLSHPGKQIKNGTDSRLKLTFVVCLLYKK